MTERPLPSGDFVRRTPETIENFRQGPIGFYPKRIVENTPRIATLSTIVLDSTRDVAVSRREVAQRRLFDLVVYNAYGNVFPQVNNATDVIGIIDEEMYPGFKNCIALGVVRGKLAIAGGFVDVEEEPRQAAMREAGEEMGVHTVKNVVPFAERSSPSRDDRFSVVSTCLAGIVNPEELVAGDDMEGVITVPLFHKGRNGIVEFNSELLEPGIHTDSRGYRFKHDGVRADHDDILIGLFNYWRDHNNYGDLSLSQVIKNRSLWHPQKMFQAEVLPHEEPHVLQRKGLKLTPNILFALEQAEKIFVQAGESDSKTKAFSFVSECVRNDILPTYPQASVTVDNLILKGDQLVVVQDKDGIYRLPGGFYSPEKEQADQLLSSTARRIVSRRFGRHFVPRLYMGSIGRQGDERYPRVSHIYMGTMSGADIFSSSNEAAYEDAQVMTIPIWTDRNRQSLSPELSEQGWLFGHGMYIASPMLYQLGRITGSDQRSAQEILLTERLV